MKLVVLLAVVAGFGITQAQVIDKPASPEDLRTEITEEKTRFEDQIQFLDQVTKTLRDAAARGSAAPGNLAAIAHAGIMVCLTTGDHKRAVSRLYGRAAVEAGRVAAQWEARGQTPANAAGLASQREFTRQIGEAERRLNELRRKAGPTPEDREEMATLTAGMSQLRSVLSLFDEVTKNSDASRYQQAAADMRQKELLFQRQAEGAQLRAGAADMECRAGLLALRSLKEQEDIQQQLRIWQLLPSENSGPGSRPTP